ncbi:HlyD family type I secretion periplasmic adaptor subunit [Flavisphingomonas formosensis]|uniref:HlyD family type I secretion periplasmic adaptor subunit n=1 Tax=Flavisphingomonas formosensis TaxID=861534 RepID=UPI0012FC8703|nr:HlyD family type I secretion periplasmic adaptor subunit [Sphingomonas formosensis]
MSERHAHQADEHHVHHMHLEDVAAAVKPRTAARMLLWAIIGTFVLLILWASFTHIDRVTHAQGRVIPSSQLQIVSNLEGGVVSEILIKPGQKVKAGQPLLRLDPTMAGADYGRGAATVAALQSKAARLEGEMQGRDPVWPADLMASSPELIAAERRVHAERMTDLYTATQAAQARLAAAQRSLSETQLAAETRDKASLSARQQADLIRPLVDKGIEPRLSLMQADNTAANAAGDAAVAHQTAGRAAASVAEARAQLAQVQADWRAKAGEDYVMVRAELEAQRKFLPASADKMRRTTLTAPVTGTVNRVMISTVGGSVPPGQPIIEIVPLRDTLVVEAAVKPEDIGFVAIGQRATVKITAYDYSLYGGIPGRVTRISPDAVLDPKEERSHYLIQVAIDRDAIVNKAGERLPVGPGMVAEVDLLGDKRTVMSYLLTPITRLEERAFRER